jgi:hypothetical protein
MLVHMSAGAPARATELVSIQQVRVAPRRCVANQIRGHLHVYCLNGTHCDATLAKMRRADSWPCDITSGGESHQLACKDRNIHSPARKNPTSSRS